MFGESKTLFKNQFFYNSLNTKPINDQEFTIMYFTSDSRNIEDASLYCFVGIQGKKYDGNDFFYDAYQQGIRVFVLDKKPDYIPDNAIVFIVNDTLDAIASLAIAHKKDLWIPYILITGSVGKTTTRMMLASILNYKYPVHTSKKNWNNAIGVPLSILDTFFCAKISVLEAGMNERGEIAHLSHIVNPDIAIITNVGYSHMEFFDNIDEIAEAKIEIVEGMKLGSLLLINDKDPYRDFFISRAKGKVICFNPDDINIVEDKGVDGFIFTHIKNPDFHFLCPIAGKHLVLNLAIIFTCMEVLQIPYEYVQMGLNSIQNLDNRMKIFTNKNQITVIADCYNASLESFEAALNVLKSAKGRKIAVIGDILELGKETKRIHQELGNKIEQDQSADLVFSVGTEIVNTCNMLKTVSYMHFEHKSDMISMLMKTLQNDDTVLVKASNSIGLDEVVVLLSDFSDNSKQ